MSNDTIDYTRLLGNVASVLDIEFEIIHTKEEFQILKKNMLTALKENKIRNKYSDSKESLIDSYIIQCDIRLRKQFKDVGKTTNELIDRGLIDLRDVTQNESQHLNTYFEALDSLIDEIPSINSYDKIFMGKILKLTEKFPSSTDYIARLVRKRLREISPEFVCVKAKFYELRDDLGYKIDATDTRVFMSNLPSTRVLILKQFIKQFGWCNGVKDSFRDKKGRGFKCKTICDLIQNKYKTAQNLAMNIDEPLFEELNNIKDGKNIRIIKIADNLANGFFSDNDSTREDIYIFAIAFEMTFSTANRNNIIEYDSDYNTDIRKNLFFDYYCGNLVDEVKNSPQKKKKYIDGYGPNLRNYAETIYLYYISKGNELSALEKFRKAKSVIDSCRTNPDAKSSLDFGYMDDNEIFYKPTEYYYDTIFEKIKALNEADFEEYIKENYECKIESDESYDKQDTAKNKHTVSMMSIGSWHMTAADTYTLLLSCFKDSDISVKMNNILEETEAQKGINLIINKYNDLVDYEKGFRHWYFNTNLSNEKTFKRDNKYVNYDDNILVRRTDLMFLLSDIVSNLFMHLPYEKQMSSIENYQSFYNYFRSEVRINAIAEDNSMKFIGADSVLIECGFQEVCSKNIFDLMVIYSSFKICHYIFSKDTEEKSF